MAATSTSRIAAGVRGKTGDCFKSSRRAIPFSTLLLWRQKHRQAPGSGVLQESSALWHMQAGRRRPQPLDCRSSVHARAESDLTPTKLRMIEEHSFNHRLEQADQIVVATNMGEFMRQDRLNLQRRHAGHTPNGQKNCRLEPTDHRRCLDVRRIQQLDGSLNAEPGTKGAQDMPNFRRHRFNGEGFHSPRRSET